MFFSFPVLQHPKRHDPVVKRFNMQALVPMIKYTEKLYHRHAFCTIAVPDMDKTQELSEKGTQAP